MKTKTTIGIIGVRGYVGRELLNLLAMHEQLSVCWVSSRQLAGQSVSTLLQVNEKFPFNPLPENHYFNQLIVEDLSANGLNSRAADIVVLALPNGLAAPFVEAITNNGNTKVIIDLSADYRFDKQWNYSVPELLSSQKQASFKEDGLIKISNPGCYATAMQIAIAPLIGKIIGRANCFGISGYSGAGTTPSETNDVKKLKDNILPYVLLEHLHEKEVSHQLNLPVSFTPHVAEFFRGISMTVQIELKTSSSLEEIQSLFEEFYTNQTSIKVTESIPNIQQVVNSPKCHVGGFKLSENGKRLTLVSCLDNLLKGAASQALQNIELAIDYDAN